MNLQPATEQVPSSQFFRDDEPIIQSHPLLPDVAVPVFGERDRWPFAAVRRPANVPPYQWAVLFSDLSATWNLRVREICMALLNPRHPALEAAGIALDRDPYQPTTLTGIVSEYRILANWANDTGRGEDTTQWTGDDMRAFTAKLAAERTSATTRNYIVAIRMLHELAPVLTDGGLQVDPWPGRTAREAADDHPREELSTQNIAPEVWFALIKAAWTYIDVFSADILRARDAYRDTPARPRREDADFPAALDRWLADPSKTIPLLPRDSGTASAGEPNWTLLAMKLGFPPRPWGLNIRSAQGRRLRSRVLAAVAEGRGHPGSIIDDLAEVTRPDGTRGPWHQGLDAHALRWECVTLRAACYTFVAAISMMRDSEIREITKGSVVEHYGAPAVVSRKRKLDPGRPLEHWWIIEPAARAIAVAEELSQHPELVFADPGISGSTDLWSYQNSPSRDWIERFIAHVNRDSATTGLHIPDGKATPHMFRKTMAMLVGTEPGGEIALGIQLKHAATRALANRVTQSYAGTDTAWARHLDTAVEEARFRRLRDLYDQHHSGQTIGYGPGAEKLTAAFDAVMKAAAEHSTRTAVGGDKRTEHTFLRKARISLRFGKLNHCTFDENNPAGARCLENTTLPPGHRGPLHDRCQPGRCHNSVITPAHLGIWRAEEHSLLQLLDTPKIAPCRREQLGQQLNDVRSVIRKAEQ